MKGHSKVVLTNVRTGQQDVYEKDNMLTKALDLIFNSNDWLIPACSSIYNKDVYMPIATKALGGLLLFDTKLEESTDNIWPRNKIIGHAGNSQTVSQDVTQGIYNLQESGEIDGGYTHVWDFGTAHGNGTIACAALTHVTFGNDLYGNENSIYIGTKVPVDRADHYNYVPWTLSAKCIDADGSVYACYDGSNISIRRVAMRPDRITLSGKGVYLSAYTELKKIEVRGVQSKLPLWREDQSKLRAYFYKDQTTINEITIDKSNYSASEKDLRIEEKIANWAQNNINTSTAAIRDKYLYVNKYSAAIILKINLDNPADITELDIPGMGYKMCDPRTGIIFVSDGLMIYADDSYRECSSYYAYMPHMYDGIYRSLVTRYQHDRMNTEMQVICPLNYMATINNLQEPITKTAEQTMKITYTITEED